MSCSQQPGSLNSSEANVRAKTVRHALGPSTTLWRRHSAREKTVMFFHSWPSRTTAVSTSAAILKRQNSRSTRRSPAATEIISPFGPPESTGGATRPVTDPKRVKRATKYDNTLAFSGDGLTASGNSTATLTRGSKLDRPYPTPP